MVDDSLITNVFVICVLLVISPLYLYCVIHIIIHLFYSSSWNTTAYFILLELLSLL